MTNKRGIVLIMACLLVSMVGAYGAAMMVQSFTEQQSAQRLLRFSAAFQAAEAGLDTALTQLASNANWTGASYTSTLKGGYDVTVTNLSSTLRNVTVTGYYPSNDASAYGYQTRRIEGVISVQSSKFDYGLFASTSIHAIDSNARVDSYDSRMGAYGGTNVGTGGNVGVNATATGSIQINSNAYVGGNAVVGPGGNTSTAISVAKTATLTGTKQTLTATKDMTSQTYTGSGSSALTQASTLSGGTYNYTYVDIPSNTTVTFSGSATIYVDKYFKLNSNAQFKTSNCSSCTLTIYVNGDSYTGAPTNAVDLNSNSMLSANSTPTQLTVYVTGTGSASRAVNMDSNNGFYGAVYAPLSSINVASNVNVYGALMGTTIDLNSGSGVHYDSALVSGGASGGTVQLLSWREL